MVCLFCILFLFFLFLCDEDLFIAYAHRSGGTPSILTCRNHQQSLSTLFYVHIYTESESILCKQKKKRKKKKCILKLIWI